MPDNYVVRFHPDFFKDLKGLDRKERGIVYKQVEKIKQIPTRFKRLHGRETATESASGI